NVAITGNGAIDGNGHYWRPLKKGKVSENFWKRATSSEGVLKRDDYWMPSVQYLHADTTSERNVSRHPKTEEEWMTVRECLRSVIGSLKECRYDCLQCVLFKN